MALHTFSIDDALAALPGFPELRGRRTRLRGPRDSDADALFAVFSDARVMRYWSRPPMTSREEAAGLVAECHEHFEARTHLGWVITARHAYPISARRLRASKWNSVHVPIASSSRCVVTIQSMRSPRTRCSAHSTR